MARTGRPVGYPKSGGRKAGTPNRRTQELVDTAEGQGMLPHELLAAVARGEEIDGVIPSFEQRIDAAKACAPYFAPRLSNSNVTQRTFTSLSEISDEELAALVGVAGAADETAGPTGTDTVQ
jgi:hypothetical protein